jgi:hypothetical protein
MRHFCEGIPGEKHFGLVQAVLSAHTLHKGGLVCGPAFRSVIVELSKHLGIICVVHAVPGVIIAE